MSPPFPILEVGLEYISGQIGGNATANGNASHEEISKQALNLDKRATQNNDHRFTPLAKQIEGPIQCGPAQQCADGSVVILYVPF